MAKQFAAGRNPADGNVKGANGVFKYFLILIAVVLFWIFYTSMSISSTMIGIDTEAGLEIGIDDDGLVMSIYSSNDNGEALIADLNLEGVELSLAMEEIIDVFVANNMLSNANNGVAVAIVNTDETIVENYQAIIETAINAKADDYGIGVEIQVIGVYDSDDSEAILEMVENYEISTTKGILVYEMIMENTSLAVEDLVNLSITELVNY